MLTTRLLNADTGNQVNLNFLPIRTKLWLKMLSKFQETVLTYFRWMQIRKQV